jgi:glycosyltransferase involved in cell wall biosynthesis
MKIAIAGTRGIPNHYGGFEQITTFLAQGLVRKGHDVTVYNSSNHPFREKNYHGVKLQHCFDLEDKLGTAGQFIYDLNCILHARKQNFDVLLFMGYTSSSVWRGLFPKTPVIVSNMDGLEWKRSKYSTLVRRFLKKAENWAIRYSDFYIADSTAIATYLKARYGIEAFYIPYGVDIKEKAELELPKEINLADRGYHLLIARMEPENNIECILEGYVKSGSLKKFVVVGNTNTSYGRYIKRKYGQHPGTMFLGGVFDQTLLEQLRRSCSVYFHGHSVGGTNPSLLEAMGSKAVVAAHDNGFNRAVLQEEAYYFSDAATISACLLQWEKDSQITKRWASTNFEKISALYSWEKITDAYDSFLTYCYQQKQTWKRHFAYKTL